MKPSRLYFKLLLSFLGVLFITEILILGLFIITAGRSFRQYVDKQSIAKLLIFKEMIQEKVNKTPLTPLDQNNEIREMLFTFSELLDVRIWVSTPDKTIVLKTFPGPITPLIKKFEAHDVLKDGIKLFHQSGRHIKYYSQIPIKMNHMVFTLHIHFHKEHARMPEVVFLFGLLCIGIIIAVLIVPLARVITKRINELNLTALEFAGGNLNRRTNLAGRDEIAELGNSFNFMADKLEKMIQGNKELTANISHELRSPLTRIRVSKELIQDRLDSNKNKNIKRYIDNIDQDIDFLDNLIDQILKLSKMDMQESLQTIEPLDFIQLFIDHEKKYRPSLQQKNLTLHKDTKEKIILNADKSIVTSVLINLFDNAVKYSKENGTIYIKAFKAEKGILTFSITNTYRKLDDLELKKIFEPFYRIDKGRNPGSGLGLTIIKKQLNQCKGQITAKNCKQGLRFEVQLPNQNLLY